MKRFLNFLFNPRCHKCWKRKDHYYDHQTLGRQVCGECIVDHVWKREHKS